MSLAHQMLWPEALGNTSVMCYGSVQNTGSGMSVKVSSKPNAKGRLMSAALVIIFAGIFKSEVTRRTKRVTKFVLIYG